MKTWIAIIGGGIVSLFVSLFLLGVAVTVLDPEGTARRQKESAERRAARQAADADKKAASKEAHSKIQQHAFAVGMTLAKSGMKKPSSDEADAMARKAALELGEDADLGFKKVWKQMFWLGWSKGGG